VLVIWSPTALRQIARIHDYLAEFNPRAAGDVVRTLIQSGDRLAEFPHQGRAVRGTPARELVTSYPYIIRYRITRDTVRILRVRHAARRPAMR
jgi:addiction module RelE/StbE family toxin